MPQNFDLSQYEHATGLENAGKLAEYITKEMFVAAETGVATHTINSWERNELLKTKRSDEQRWRRFNFVQFIWVRMIDTMRQIGLSHEVIRGARETLVDEFPYEDLWRAITAIPGHMEKILENATDEERPVAKELFGPEFPESEVEAQVSVLQLLITDAVIKRIPISVAVFLDGTVIPIMPEDAQLMKTPDDMVERLTFEPHARVSITALLKEFLASDLAASRIGKLHVLDDNETTILQMIHSGEYKKVTINFRNRKMDTLELVKDHETTRKVVDVMADAAYQDITIVTHKGMIAKIENTMKVKLKRK
ncbi:MAG: MerR family transcriptional regulator [Bacteroidota bacterium]